MRKNHSFFIPAALFGAMIAFNACSGDQSGALQSQVDSLTSVVEQQAQDLDYYQSCLTIVSEGLDSIAKADSSLISITSGNEGTVTRESVRENLQSYADLLTRQHQRIDDLEQKLGNSSAEVKRMSGLIAMLNKQIAEKEATIQSLREKVELSNFSISMLQGEVNRLSDANAQLTTTVSAQGEAIQAAQEMLNEAYYIVGTSKELKASGILSKKFLGKTKVDADNIDASLFTKIDIRNVTQITVDDKSVTIKSQHPSGSYQVVSDKKSNTSVIQILDEVAFWSLTRYLIIQK